MKNAVVIDAVRTPVGRASADRGYFRDVRSEDLSAHVMQALLKRTGIAPKEIEDVRWGCVMQQGEQGFDIARIAAMVAGLPPETGGRDDQPQLRVQPAGDQRRGDEHRRRLRGRADRRRRRAHGPCADDERLQPLPLAVSPP